MTTCDALIRNAILIDGSGGPETRGDLAIRAGRIAAIGDLSGWISDNIVQADGQVLSPGFIDAHTHDDTQVIRSPQSWPKLSQGVTTVIVGNCGISAAPVSLRNAPPDPLNLLGPAEAFTHPTFRAYAEAIDRAHPAVNVAALVGHTSLRQNHLDRLDRPATASEIAAMRTQLQEALTNGALGLSTGLAYANARAAPSDEVMALATVLAEAGALYTTHLRTEATGILDALDEAFRTGHQAQVPVVISHLKCAGVENWGRAHEVLAVLDGARRTQPIGCDCYPYTASSSTLDPGQVTDRFDIVVTWSQPHPAQGGRLLADIARDWNVDLHEATRRLMPAGAIYHCMAEADVRAVLGHPATMIGSDGLPDDPQPHPRLWGAFPRVLGHYCRDQRLFPLTAAVHKMTGLTAARFGLDQRGLLRIGFHADLVLFDPATIRDRATFAQPMLPAGGITAVWVNGMLSVSHQTPTGQHAGRFLPRGRIAWPASDQPPLQRSHP